MIAISLLFMFLAYVAYNIAIVAWRNREAQKFFKLRSPNLPTLPETNIFTGNMYQIVFKEKNCDYIDEMHSKLGHTFGAYYSGFPIIFTKDVDVIKRIEIDESHIHINKTDFYLPLKEYRDSILQTRDDVWRRSRRVIGPMLSASKIKGDEVSNDLRDIVKQLHEAFKERIDKNLREKGEPSFILHVDDMCDRFTLASIFSIGYKQDNLIDFKADVDEWTSVLVRGKRDGANKIVGLPMVFPFLRPLAYILYNLSEMGKMRDKIMGYAQKVLQMYKKAYKGKSASDSSHHSMDVGFKRRFVDAMIDAYFERKITRDDLMGNMWVFVFAGYVTTADTLTNLLWELARHPEIQDRLRKALIENGLEDNYVSWCVNESIRCHPASPLAAGRELKEDIVVNGLLLPAGAYVTVSSPSVHSDPKLWPDPLTFKPERWADRSSFHPAQFVGFGLGPRSCPGANLAIHEIKLALEMIVTNYRIEKCEETVEEYKFSSPLMFVTYVDKPIKLRLVALS